MSHEICVICVCCPDGLRVSIQYPAPDWVHCQTEAKHLEGGALLAAFCAFDVVNRSFMIGEAVLACVVYYCSTYYARGGRGIVEDMCYERRHETSNKHTQSDWLRCDIIPAAVDCASVSRWACRKRRRKNSPSWNFFSTCAAGLGDAKAALRRCGNLTELDLSRTAGLADTVDRASYLLIMTQAPTLTSLPMSRWHCSGSVSRYGSNDPSLLKARAVLAALCA